MRGIFTSVRSILAQISGFFSASTLEFFPMRRTLGRYNLRKLRGDLGAGTNVALLAFPQSMAFALIAGLDNVAFGITCTVAACLLAPLFVASRLVSFGPTNATSLMVYSALAGTGIAAVDRAHFLPVMIFLTGLLLIIGAYLRMADMIQYISRSVVVGYVTGAACLIIAGQLCECLGIQLPATPDEPHSRGVFRLIGEIFDHGHFIHWLTTAVSLGTLALYMALRRFAPRAPAFAVTLLGASVVMAVLRHFKLPADVTTLKDFHIGEILTQLPDFRDAATLERMSLLFGPAVALAFLAALETSVMGKTLASRSGERPDPNQDMLALGVANIGASFVGQLPVSASLTRSAFNQESGAATQISSLVTGIVCIAAALFLGSIVKFIPRCSLGVLIIAVAVGLFNRRHLRICMRATRADAITLIVTLVSTLMMPLHVAIFVGVATSIVLYLRKAARPMLVEYSFNLEGGLQEKPEHEPRLFPQISIVHVEGELFFGAAELFRTQIQRTVVDPNLRVIILRMKNARHLDATSVMALEDLIKFLRSKDRHLIISGAMKGVYRVLKNSGMVEIVGRENVFLGSAHNPNLSTRNALKRAQELMGTKQAEIRIYYDPSKKQET